MFLLLFLILFCFLEWMYDLPLHLLTGTLPLDRVCGCDRGYSFTREKFSSVHWLLTVFDRPELKTVRLTGRENPISKKQFYFVPS